MLECKLIKRGDEAEVLMIGRLDSNSAVEAEKALMALTSSFQTIVFNMEKLEYLSSAGLRIFRTMHVTMSKKGGKLELTNVAPLVMEVLEITGFAGIFRIR